MINFKKSLKWLVSLLVIVALLGACGSSEEGATTNNGSQSSQTESDNNAEQEESVHITISKNEGEETLTEKTVAIEEGAILIDVMGEHFELETDFNGAFIVSIDGVGPEDGEEVAWMYSVNGEVPMVGANEYELQPGDEVVFDLQPW